MREALRRPAAPRSATLGKHAPELFGEPKHLATDPPGGDDQGGSHRGKARDETQRGLLKLRGRLKEGNDETHRETRDDGRGRKEENEGKRLRNEVAENGRIHQVGTVSERTQHLEPPSELCDTRAAVSSTETKDGGATGKPSEERGADAEAATAGSESAEAFLHAAESPTAVWDEDALRAAGLEVPEGDEEESAPATAPDMAALPSATVEVAVDLHEEAEGTGSEPRETDPRPVTHAPRPEPPGLSWPATLAIAAALGVVVYFLVRMLR